MHRQILRLLDRTDTYHCSVLQNVARNSNGSLFCSDDTSEFVCNKKIPFELNLYFQKKIIVHYPRIR
jgi:hypothetical protein